MNKRHWTVGVIAIAAVALIGGLIWWWTCPEIDAEVQEIFTLQTQMFSDEFRSRPEAERQQLLTDLRARRDQLSERQQRQLRELGGQERGQRMQQQIQAYFDLSPKQRRAYLDQQIHEMEQRRRQFASRANGAGRAGSPQGRGGGGRGWGGPGQGGGRGPRTDEQRDDFKRRRLDSTTPKQRAQMSEYFAALRERREQLGLGR
ncbi:MAG: hypothetical protein R3E01_03270 [Pirellulaceae bacterium]|nr:hypothetical protein [Planctomycetales bacterium]